MAEQSSPSVERIVPTIEKLFDGQIVLLLLTVLLAANVLAAQFAGVSVFSIEWSTLSSKPGLMLALIVTVGVLFLWLARSPFDSPALFCIAT